MGRAAGRAGDPAGDPGRGPGRPVDARTARLHRSGRRRRHAVPARGGGAARRGRNGARRRVRRGRGGVRAGPGSQPSRAWTGSATCWSSSRRPRPRAACRTGSCRGHGRTSRARPEWQTWSCATTCCTTSSTCPRSCAPWPPRRGGVSSSRCSPSTRWPGWTRCGGGSTACGAPPSATVDDAVAVLGELGIRPERHALGPGDRAAGRRRVGGPAPVPPAGADRGRRCGVGRAPRPPSAGRHPHLAALSAVPERATRRTGTRNSRPPRRVARSCAASCAFVRVGVRGAGGA